MARQPPIRRARRRWTPWRKLGSGPTRRAEKARQRASLTVSGLIDAFVGGRVAKLKPKSRVSCEAGLAKTRAAHGAIKAEALTRAQVAALHVRMAATPYAANRMLAAVSSLYPWAERHGLLPEGHRNPAAGITRYKELGRERFLTTDELARLGDALREGETIRLPYSVDETKPNAKHVPKAENRLVTQFLKEREAVSGAAHAHMQIDRLGRAMRVASDALARAGIRAIAPFIRVIDRLDRYQTLAAETAARPEAVVDRAGDQLVVNSVFARARRTVPEELKTQAAESDAAAAGPPPEPDGDPAAIAPPVVAEAQEAPPALAPSAARPGAAAAQRCHGWRRFFLLHSPRKPLISLDSW